MGGMRIPGVAVKCVDIWDTGGEGGILDDIDAEEAKARGSNGIRYPGVLALTMKLVWGYRSCLRS